MVQKLMRHENVATTAKYAHAFDEDVLAAMEAETAVRQQVPLQTPLQQADEDNQSVESTDKKSSGLKGSQTRRATRLSYAPPGAGVRYTLQHNPASKPQ